jgi:ATP-dependent Zn protease
MKGIDSGDVADIGQATLEAYAAIAHLGMDDDLGYINIQLLSENISPGFLKEKIEESVLIWLNDAKIKTEQLVDTYWEIINLVAKKLIEKEMLSGEELTKLIQEFHSVA